MQVGSHFADRSMFFTGGTGFVGKLFLERILTRNPEIGKIYLLIRPKKGQDAHARFKQDILDSDIFARLKQTTPDFEQFIAKKFKVVEGDLSLPGLGLSKENRNEIQKNANLFVSNAADVRWDIPILEAMESNLNGPLRIMELAKQASKVDHFIHLSTIGIQGEIQATLEEKIYNIGIDGPEYLRALQEGSEEFRAQEDRKIAERHSTSYFVSKCLSECMLDQQKAEIPLTVIRGCSIGSSIKDPFPGWLVWPTAYVGLYLYLGMQKAKCYNVTGGNKFCEMPMDHFVNYLALADVAFAGKSGSHVFNAAPTNNLTMGEAIDECLEQWRYNGAKISSRPIIFQQLSEYHGYMNNWKKRITDEHDQKLFEKTERFNKMYYGVLNWYPDVINSQYLQKNFDRDLVKKDYPIDLPTDDYRDYLKVVVAGLAKKYLHR